MAEIEYSGAKLNIHPLLALVWPYDFPYQKWPTFCGAGSGLGDRIIPEYICKVRVSCVCGDHDIRWSVSEDSFAEALKANWILYQNLRVFVWQNCDKTKYKKSTIEFWCLWWFRAVCWGAMFHFSPLGGGDTGNPEVNEKLARLDAAILKYKNELKEATV